MSPPRVCTEHPPGPAEEAPLGKEDPWGISSSSSSWHLLCGSEGRGIGTKAVPDLFQEFRVR